MTQPAERASVRETDAMIIAQQFIAGYLAEQCESVKRTTENSILWSVSARRPQPSVALTSSETALNGARAASTPDRSFTQPESAEYTGR